MSVPETPGDVAAAMDSWEAVNGSVDLFEELVRHLGPTRGGELWDEACKIYDMTH